MEENLMKHEAQIDGGYEFFQIIRDFGNPIQIFREAFQNSVDENATQVHCRVSVEKGLGKEDLFIDVWDNGTGLHEADIPTFFGLAKSTKLTPDRTPAGKLGYKGHGTKIYFNSDRIEICSRPEKGKTGWGVVLDDPVGQIRKFNSLRYSDLIGPEDCTVSLPTSFETGFFVRIRNPFHFRTQHTRYMLNHMYLRDYSKWFTAFGTIRPLFDKKMPTANLYLCGLNMEYFAERFNDVSRIDPLPQFIGEKPNSFEVISMGHYLPPQRAKEEHMKNYCEEVGTGKAYYDYYSDVICKERVYLDGAAHFDFVVGSEGYETKRRYDVLLKGRGKPSPDFEKLQHTDAERYGLWACKGGVPIEKVDEWLVGGKGVGTYTYLHALVDCDAFDLTANRGSIKNSDLEIVEQVRHKIADILSEKKVQDKLRAREQYEEMEKTLRSIGQDEEELKQRFKAASARKYIVLPDKTRILEPTKTKTGGYSESETLMVLMRVQDCHPGLFQFNILDYNTTKGIDFVVEKHGSPKYIELKGTFRRKLNHSFRHIDRFICYELEMNDGDVVEDIEELKTTLKVKKDDVFESPNKAFHKKKYTSYQLVPESAVIKSMEIIVLKEFLSQVVGATFE